MKTGVIRIDYTITRGDLAEPPVSSVGGEVPFRPTTDPISDAMYVSGDLDPFMDSQAWKMLVGGMLHHKVVRDLTNGP